MSKDSRIDEQKLWCAIRVYRNFSIPKIAKRCEVDFDSAQKFVFMLRRHDYVTWQDGDKNHTLFKLISDTGAMAPSQNSKGFKDPNMAGLVEDVFQRLWNAICRLNSWQPMQLASVAVATKGKALGYTRLLVGSGYAKCEPRNGRTVESADHCQLLLKTGAIAPLFQANGEVFDSNLFLKELWDEQKKPRRTRSPKPKAEVWIL